MAEPTNPPTFFGPPSLDDLPELVRLRTLDARQRDGFDANVDFYNQRIETILTAHGLKRYQLPDGTIVQMAGQNAKTVKILAERLLELGVSPDIIKEATLEKPKQPYVRVDGPSPDVTTAGGPEVHIGGQAVSDAAPQASRNDDEDALF